MVHNHQINITNQNDKDKDSNRNGLSISSNTNPLNDGKVVPLSLSLAPASLLPPSDNPLESLTFENILKSATAQQKNKGKPIVHIKFSYYDNLIL